VQKSLPALAIRILGSKNKNEKQKIFWPDENWTPARRKRVTSKPTLTIPVGNPVGVQPYEALVQTMTQNRVPRLAWRIRNIFLAMAIKTHTIFRRYTQIDVILSDLCYPFISCQFWLKGLF
jgi:hypothetical protein